MPCPHAGRQGYRFCRSEEHTSELQSRQYLVCRLLLEKKNQTLEIPTVLPVPEQAPPHVHLFPHPRAKCLFVLLAHLHPHTTLSPPLTPPQPLPFDPSD